MSDALASLRQALGPKTGIQRVSIPLQSYPHFSRPLTTERLLNMFAEQAPKDARAGIVLSPVPGLVELYEAGSGPVLAMNADHPGHLYVVSGDHFYRITFVIGSPPAPPTIEDLGYVGLSSTVYGVPTIPTIAVSENAAVVCVPPNAFTCTHDGALNQIGGDVFEGASSVDFVDGYFVFTDVPPSARWFISRLADPTDFDALDFAHSDGVTNLLSRVITHRGEVWLMGHGGIEVWYDAGEADFPFRRRPGGVIPFPIATPAGVAIADGSLWWVGPDNVVYRSAGYQAKRVSTHAVERTIEDHNSETAVAFTYEQNGHTYYVLTVGTSAPRTLVYDAATELWHERSSSSDGLAPYRLRSAPDVGRGLVYGLGDNLSGKIFAPRIGLSTEDGLEVMRQVQLPPIWAGTKRDFCSRVEIEMETGDAAHAPSTLRLDWSDDGSELFSLPRELNAIRTYDHRTRVFTTRLGSFRERVFRITAFGITHIYAVDADIQPGAW